MDELWAGGPCYKHRIGLFPLSSDTAWLGGFLRLGGVRTAIDLGCGGGALSLQILGRKPSVCLTAVDILSAAAEQTAQNAARNGFSVQTVTGNLADYKTLLPRERFDLAASNPPYYPLSHPAAEGERGGARRESCTLSEWVCAAAWTLRFGGHFCLVYLPERLSELLCTMTEAGIEPKRLRMIHKDEHTAPSAVLVDGCKGGKIGLSIEPPLFAGQKG